MNKTFEVIFPRNWMIQECVKYSVGRAFNVFWHRFKTARHCRQWVMEVKL